MKQLKLSGKHGAGIISLVDDEDYEDIGSRKWHLGTGGYVTTYKYIGQKDGRSNYSPVLLHRYIMQAPKGLEVDHINGDRLDNRRENLRLCTRQENHWNTRRRTTSATEFKGIYRRRNGLYVARITFEGSCIGAGSSHDPIEAAALYDAAAIQLFGEFASVNVL